MNTDLGRRRARIWHTLYIYDLEKHSNIKAKRDDGTGSLVTASARIWGMNVLGEGDDGDTHPLPQIKCVLGQVSASLKIFLCS